MTKFKGKRGDLTWGKYDYPVTKTQKATLDGIWYMWSELPSTPARADGLPVGGFFSQRHTNGDVVIGLFHCSVSVHRNGRVTSNARSHRPVGEWFDREREKDASRA